MKYKSKLEPEEWNLLAELTMYNHMDSWFELRNGGRYYDFVRDVENNVNMKLRDAVEEVAEGMDFNDLKLFIRGIPIWNSIMDRFGLLDYKTDKNGRPMYETNGK